MTDTKRKDVLEGLELMTQGPYRVVDTAYGNCIGAARGPTGGRTLYVQSPTGGGFQEANAQGFARVPELVDEIRELRATLRRCVVGLEAVQNHDGHAPSTERMLRDIRALLPDTGDD